MTKVLVVDDERNLRALYHAELTEEGYQVFLASDCPEAVRLMEDEKPDLVVLDIRMPGADGLETMGHLLARDNRVPIILNTAFSSYRDNFLSWSADAYVVKSSDVSDLKTRIREVLSARSSSERSPRA